MYQLFLRQQAGANLSKMGIYARMSVNYFIFTGRCCYRADSLLEFYNSCSNRCYYYSKQYSLNNQGMVLGHSWDMCRRNFDFEYSRWHKHSPMHVWQHSRRHSQCRDTQ